MKLKVLLITLACLLAISLVCLVSYKALVIDYISGQTASHPATTAAIKYHNLDTLTDQKMHKISPAKGWDNILPYHNKSDLERTNEFKAALAQHNKKYLWATHGGYGSARIIDKLDIKIEPENRKIIIGYSDITALLLLADIWNWQSIHGTMEFELFKEKKKSDNFSFLEDMVLGKKNYVTYYGIIPINESAKKVTEINSKLIGGNLSVIATSLATQWQLQPKNRILFLEDVHEPGYNVDRNLLHLKQANMFKNSQAVLLGSFGHNTDIDYTLNRFAAEMNIPVFRADIFGHGNTNFPLPLNTNTVIKCNEGRCNIRLDTPSTEENTAPLTVEQNLQVQ